MTMTKTLLYLAKEPFSDGVKHDLQSFKDYDITICACNAGYVDYYKLLGYNVITSSKLFAGVDMRFDVVIGNPPYGNGGKQAVKFLNICGDLSDTIIMVLPLSIRRASLNNMVRDDLMCVKDIRCDDDTFRGSIKACIQTWVKSDTPRERIQIKRTHKDFVFVDREEADLMIGRCGSGPAGRVKTENFIHYKKDHFFIKVNDQSVTDTLIELEDKFRVASEISNGMRVLSKHDLITIYDEHVSTLPG